MLDDLDLSNTQDECSRAVIVRLLNLIETLTADLRATQAENQRLRDEINRLKGEQGKPTLTANSPTPPPPEHSSETERHRPITRLKRGKRDRLHIDRPQDVAVDPARSPARNWRIGRAIRQWMNRPYRPGFATVMPTIGVQTYKWIMDAAAVAAYHAQTKWPVMQLLVCDGALQFTWVTVELGLCWVHEGRHYKKPSPSFSNTRRC